jgi:hypothetical protein
VLCVFDLSVRRLVVYRVDVSIRRDLIPRTCFGRIPASPDLRPFFFIVYLLFSPTNSAFVCVDFKVDNVCIVVFCRWAACLVAFE